MPAKYITRPHRKPAIGDLRTPVKLQTRSIDSPDFEGADFDELFSDVPETPASVRTLRDQTRFDGVSQDERITHEVLVRYCDDVNDSQTWIFVCHSGDRLKVLGVENFEERNEWLLLDCQFRGHSDQEASKA
jgi:hypothetical protein